MPRTAVFLNAGADLSAAVGARPPRRRPRLRQRVGHPRRRARRAPRALQLRARRPARGPRHRRHPDLPAASRAPRPGGAHARGRHRRAAAPRDRREPSAGHGGRARPGHGPAAGGDARVRRGAARRAHRPRRARGARYRAAWQSGVPTLPAPPPILLAGLAARCSSSRARSPTASSSGCARPIHPPRGDPGAAPWPRARGPRARRLRGGRRGPGRGDRGSAAAGRCSRRAHAVPRAALLPGDAGGERLRSRGRGLRQGAARGERPGPPRRRTRRGRELHRHPGLRGRASRGRRDPARDPAHRLSRRASLPAHASRRLPPRSRPRRRLAGSRSGA